MSASADRARPLDRGDADTPGASDAYGVPRQTVMREVTSDRDAYVADEMRFQVERMVFSPHAAMTWPMRIGVVPGPADCLQRRSSEADVLAAIESTVTATQILCGLGGVGKTQLAAMVAERVWREGRVQLLMWVTASSRSAIVAAFAQAAMALGVDGGLLGEDGAGRFLAWAAATNQRWLLVLDDLADPDDLRGLWPPATDAGATMVTTRRHDAALSGHAQRMVQVDLFTQAEAAAYLADKLMDHLELADDVSGLVADLGRLPLALAQAAAFLVDLRMPCSRYRIRLADRLRKLADLAPDRLPDDQSDAVAATWSLSIEHANALRPRGLARPVLTLASVLDPNGIPLDVLTAPACRAWLTATFKQALSVDAEMVSQAVRCLDRLSLATCNPDGSIRIHALVQRASRDQTPDLQLDAATLAAADGLVDAWPAVERSLMLGQILRANVNALVATRCEPLWTADGGHAVLFHAGSTLGETGQVTAARDYFSQLKVEAARRLGPEHADSLSVRQHLAHWRGKAGDPAGAVAEFEALLTDRLRVLGPAHIATLGTSHDLARWRGEAGDPARAVAEFEELLTDQLRVLGPDHPDTLNTRHNLAYWRGQAGYRARAIAEFEALLTDRLRILGPDHPGTLNTRHNLAYGRGEAGDPVEAVAEFEVLLADQLRVLGPDHPDTLDTRQNLARWRGEAGHPVEAVAEFEVLLADQLRVLGPDHPGTLGTHRHLAYWLANPHRT